MDKGERIDGEVTGILNAQFDAFLDLYDAEQHDREEITISCIRASMERWCNEWQANRK